jgi:catechol 2,3-dioxygenase-like lactoylglutathione lyase family enzyme
MPLRLNRISLPVRDRDKQLAFYRDVLGLPVKGDASDPNVVELDAGPCSLLLTKTTRPFDSECAARLTFFSDNPADLHEELQLLGIKVGKIKEFGPHQSFDGTDPEGNPFQITNRP